MSNKKGETVKELYNKKDSKEIKINEEDKKSLGRKIFDVVFWVCIIVLAAIWLTDFFRIKGNNKPMFCLANKTHEFEDGTVQECKGLGYKIYSYDRESLKGFQFGPFFAKMKK